MPSIRCKESFRSGDEGSLRSEVREESCQEQEWEGGGGDAMAATLKQSLQSEH